MKKEYRVKKSEEIQSIIKEKNVIGSKEFVVYKKENHENKHFRLAISVPKKYGHAVDRNLIKRRIKSIVKERKIEEKIDLFIVVKQQAKELEFNQIKEKLNDLFNKTL